MTRAAFRETLPQRLTIRPTYGANPSKQQSSQAANEKSYYKLSITLAETTLLGDSKIAPTESTSGAFT